MHVTVNVKSIAKRKNSVQAVPFYLESPPHTVHELITGTVQTCVEKYEERKEQEILKALSREEIADQAEAGKISFGVNYGEADADYEKALANALQSYEDGIYRIFINDEEAGGLDQEITVDEETSLTFVRLTMLSGRMW